MIQETLLAVHLKRHTWQDDRPFLPWLRAIARYVARCIGARVNELPQGANAIGL